MTCYLCAPDDPKADEEACDDCDREFWRNPVAVFVDDAGEDACPTCGRVVALVTHDGGVVVCRHDNRNNSGFCKGSLTAHTGGSRQP